MNIFIPGLFEGYSIRSQTVSELSAIDAPTRPLWVFLAVIYILLFAAFGAGIWLSSTGNRFLRRTAIWMGIYALINVYWPPMHLRGNPPTLTDALHITWAMITLVLMSLIMWSGAKAMGKAFRIYTVFTFIIFLVFGLLIGKEAPGILDNLPTPHIGVWERLNIGAFMLWIIVFSIRLLASSATTPVPGRNPVVPGSAVPL